MRKSLQNIYESMLVEVAGALNYWVTPNGQLTQVPSNLTHMKFAQQNFNDIDWLQYKKDVIEGRVGWKDSYDVVYRAGYIRVVEQPSTIHISYNRAKPPNKTQANTLKELCETKEKNLYDDETNKILIKQNEMDPTLFSRASLMDKLSKELENQNTSFYKNKPMGDSFSAYDLNDYTKLIYEYNVEDPSPEDSNKQAIIDKAIYSIQRSIKKGDNHLASTEDEIDRWIQTMINNDFTPEEIKDVLYKALGRDGGENKFFR